MNGASRYFGKPNQPQQILLASDVRVESGIGDAMPQLGEWDVLMLQLDVTDAEAASDDTLDVFVQTTIDGENWIDIAHFTQVLGDGGPVRYVTKLVASAAETEFETGTALTAAAVRNLVGDQYRVRWDIVDGSEDSSQSFTFSVTANCK